DDRSTVDRLPRPRRAAPPRGRVTAVGRERVNGHAHDGADGAVAGPPSRHDRSMSQSGPTTTAPRRPFATTLIALVLGGLVGLLGAAPTHAATTREHVTPSSGANPTGLTAGPDGAIWFTQPGSGRIG